jgi:uncharacterized protein (TIGR02145 family)
VEGEVIDLTISDNSLTFIVPKLNQGSYKLVFQEKNKPYNIPFQVKAHNLKGTPANYIQTYLDKSQMQVERLEKTKNLLAGEKKVALEKDIAMMKGFLEEQYAKAALLKENELADMAFFIEANKEWMDEVFAAVNELNANFPNARISGEVVTNIEALGNRVSGKFVAAVITVVKHIPKIVSAFTIGYLTGSIFGPLGSSLGAAIGLGISIGNLLLDLEELLGSIDAVADFVKVVADNIMEVNVRTIYSFQNNESTELFVSRNYRTVYSGDVNSSVPFVRDFMGGIKTLLTEWQTLKSKIPLDLVFAPTDYSAISTYKTTNQRVHSDHLSISEITNPKVSNTVTKEEGRLLVKMSTAVESEETFKFDLVYNNSDFGKLTTNNDGVINSKFGTITDPRDGNVYKTVQIGTQIWFAENLRYAGNIPHVPSEEDWNAIFNQNNPIPSPAWCNLENNPDNDLLYGKLYNGYAMKTGVLCPPGWHIPSLDEWLIFYDYLGGSQTIVGDKIRSVTGWEGNNFGATNESGFSGILSSLRDVFGKFYPNHWARYWTSSLNDLRGGSVLELSTAGVSIFDVKMNYGHSCRCIKD